MFNNEVIGEAKEKAMGKLNKELDKVYNDIVIKNNKLIDEDRKSLLEKMRQKIKGKIVKGEIKNKEDLKAIFDQASTDYASETITSDGKSVLFSEWREKNEAQISNLLLEDERIRSEKAKKFMTDKLEHVANKLSAKEEEITNERKKAFEKVDEIAKERDEALTSANKLRTKLSEIIKDKMKFETEAQLRYQKMEKD